MEDIVTAYEKYGYNMSLGAFPTLTHGFLRFNCYALRDEHCMRSQQAKRANRKDASFNSSKFNVMSYFHTEI
jgi:hypothetical protein